MDYIENIVERQDGGWLKECAHCTSRYESVREDSLYCCATCRKSASRLKKKAQKRREDLLRIVDEICDSHLEGDMEVIVRAHKRLSGFLSCAGWANIEATYYDPND